MGYFCDQLCKQFLPNLLKILIIKPEVTYLITFNKDTSCQSSHFCNMNLFKACSMHLLITLLSKPFFYIRSQGGICDVRHFLLNMIRFVKWATLYFLHTNVLGRHNLSCCTLIHAIYGYGKSLKTVKLYLLIGGNSLPSTKVRKTGI